MLFVEKLFLWFLLYSFCGWVYESILVSILERRPVNRGFLNGPLCPIYGAGAVGAVVVLGQVHNPLVVFLLSMVGASILEYVTSWVMEALFHARWWDYSDYKFNLNGRICLLGAFVFGVGGVLITSVIQPQVAGVTDRLPLPAIHWLCGVLFVLTLIDLVVTVCGIMHFENSLDNLMAAMTHYGDAMKVAVSDVTGKMSESWKSGKEMSFDFMMRVRDAAMSIFNRQQRRMIASFPKLRTERNNDVLEQLRRILESLLVTDEQDSSDEPGSIPRRFSGQPSWRMLSICSARLIDAQCPEFDREYQYPWLTSPISKRPDSIPSLKNWNGAG